MRIPRSFLTAILVAAFGLPVLAQTDFSGQWAPVPQDDNSGDPFLGEFTGIPLSPAGQQLAQTWSESLLTLPEWQCQPMGAMYITHGPSPVRIWKEVDPVSRQITAYHAEWLRTIDNSYYMDGRALPSDFAPHTWGGFSTAEWIGDMLKITTTHLKSDYHRQNGVPSSDQATLTQFWMRRGDILTWTTIAYDPIYLSEPMIRSIEYRSAPEMQIPAYPCTVTQEVAREEGVVPHYLPGQNPFLGEFGEKYHIPLEATLGGAASMRPEMQRRIEAAVNHP